jgi:hypothetical protein
MGLVVPSSYADFRAPSEIPLFGVDFFARLFERVFCPHPSLTALFLKCPMSAINPANNSSNTHTPGSLTWSLTSLLHTLIHPHRSSHSLLPASFYFMLSKFGVLPAVKVILCNPGEPCTLRFTQILLSVHSTFPTPLLANILSSTDITCTTPCII